MQHVSRLTCTSNINKFGHFSASALCIYGSVVNKRKSWYLNTRKLCANSVGALRGLSGDSVGTIWGHYGDTMGSDLPGRFSHCIAHPPRKGRSLYQGGYSKKVR